MIGRGFALALIACGMLVACQAKPPTEIVNTTQSDKLTFEQSAEKILAANPVILDTRSPLDFGVTHVPGAINVAWTDFTVPGAKVKGLLDPDDFALARRLALWGIDPQRPVLVMGDDKTAGEAGWVAWMLRSLGVKTVNTGTPKYYRGQIPRPEGAPENKPMWKPDVRTDLRATPAEGREFLKGPATTGGRTSSKARSRALQGAPLPFEFPRKKFVIDLRSEAERKALPLTLFGWKREPLTMKMEWFWGPLGINAMVVDELKNHEITRESEILVVSESGLESGAAVYALDVLGFPHARNLIAGVRGLGSGK